VPTFSQFHKIPIFAPPCSVWTVGSDSIEANAELWRAFLCGHAARGALQGEGLCLHRGGGQGGREEMEGRDLRGARRGDMGQPQVRGGRAWVQVPRVIGVHSVVLH